MGRILWEIKSEEDGIYQRGFVSADSAKEVQDWYRKNKPSIRLIYIKPAEKYSHGLKKQSPFICE